MHIEIDDNPLTGIYSWTLYDGPEGIDHYEGQADTLGEAFEVIIARRTMIGLAYYSKE
jgi:hypothetical protein